MVVNLVDRVRLQSHLESDLAIYLKACKSNSLTLDLAERFRVQEQIRNLNRKSNDLGVTHELTSAAFEKFLVIQKELSELSFDPDLIKKVKDQLFKWLPPIEFIWDELWRDCAFGPGTVFHARKPHERSIHYKIGGLQTVSPKAYQLAVEVIGKYYPRFAQQITRCEVVPGNRIAHVSKDVSKCRQIAVEPSLNVFLQKGVGAWLVRHMRRLGIADLETGQDYHRELVKHYTKYGTIDLSDASDRISLGLMRLILPPDWFELLDSLRSHLSFHNGKWYKLESFSSQGNAFTFPVETIVFKAVALAVSTARVSVYGDDIVAHLGDCPKIASALESCGFKVNVTKSFWGQHDGIEKFFRESCGEDTLFGVSVRSVFFKDPAQHPSQVASLMNMLYEKWGFLPATHSYLASVVPREKWLLGPSRFWTSCLETGHNVEAREYSSWLWEELGEHLGFQPEPWCYDPTIQTYVRKQKYWSSMQKELSSRYQVNDEVEWLEFLYSGTTMASPLSRPKTRVKTLVKFAMAV